MRVLASVLSLEGPLQSCRQLKLGVGQVPLGNHFRTAKKNPVILFFSEPSLIRMVTKGRVGPQAHVALNMYVRVSCQFWCKLERGK